MAKDPTKRPTTSVLSLAADEKRTLLSLARESIESAVAGRRPARERAFEGKLAETCGAFVTITIGGQLRGCIGSLRTTRPLGETVQEMARAAALEDPRFPSLGPDELPGVKLEISVLSPFADLPADRVGEITIGVHGLYVSKGGRSGLLLPQVPMEYGWDVDEFLRHTCFKAGLPADAWKTGARIQVFSAEVFSEEGTAI